MLYYAVLCLLRRIPCGFQGSRTGFPGVPFGNPWDSVEYSTEVAVAAKWVPRDDFRSNSMVPGQTETSAKTI